MLLRHHRLLHPFSSPFLVPQSLKPLSTRQVQIAAAAKPYRHSLDKLLDRPWLLKEPNVELTEVHLPAPSAGDLPQRLHIIRDDLLHPVAGSKLRKFDALLPSLQAQGVTDVVTCGGAQSAHIAAVAALAAEHGMRAHLLVRGEQPQVPTGYHLLARTFGDVTYVSRTNYANRQSMLELHTARILKSLEQKSKLALIPEGGSDATALLGLIRLAQFLGTRSSFQHHRTQLVVSSGTGTTAIGLALGVALLQLPWAVTGVMLAGTRSYYESQAQVLVEAFSQQQADLIDRVPTELPLTWVERHVSRRFGNVKPGEIATCQHIARTFGVLLDPIYELAAWEVACAAAALAAPEEHVAMLHAGGGLGLQGLAQRFPDEF